MKHIYCIPRFLRNVQCQKIVWRQGWRCTQKLHLSSEIVFGHRREVSTTHSAELSIKQADWLNPTPVRRQVWKEDTCKHYTQKIHTTKTNVSEQPPFVYIQPAEAHLSPKSITNNRYICANLIRACRLFWGNFFCCHYSGSGTGR